MPMSRPPGPEKGGCSSLWWLCHCATRVSALCLQVKGSQQEVSSLSTALQKATSEAETSASQITEAEARVGSLQMELQVPHTDLPVWSLTSAAGVWDISHAYTALYQV